MLFTNAKSLGFRSGVFDIVICGFMGWYDCYDFARGEFTQPDTKSTEMWRVLRDGGRFVCCTWEEQQDLAWMEEAIIRHYPEILEDDEYLAERPIGMAYEKVDGYEIILREAGFRDIEHSKETQTFVSTDAEEWWRQMLYLGWDSLLEKLEDDGIGQLQRTKEAVFRDLQQYQHADGIRFDKVVSFVRGVK